MKAQAGSSQLPRNASILAALLLVTVIAFVPSTASAAVGAQLESFYYNDGTVVVSRNGEPDDAVLNRHYDTQHEGINWQFMTQNLAPHAWYDVWIEGTNDGSAAGAFSWWVGRVRATARGDLNGFGLIWVGTPLGPYSGSFTNPRAAVRLVIRTP